MLRAAIAIVGRTTVCPYCGVPLVVPPPPPVREGREDLDATNPIGFTVLPTN